MTTKIKILDRTGHSTAEFDTSVEDAVAEAERIVEDAFSRGSMVFDESSKERIADGSYVPSEHDSVIVVPAFQGG